MKKRRAQRPGPSARDAAQEAEEHLRAKLPGAVGLFRREKPVIERLLKHHRLLRPVYRKWRVNHPAITIDSLIEGIVQIAAVFWSARSGPIREARREVTELNAQIAEHAREIEKLLRRQLKISGRYYLDGGLDRPHYEWLDSLAALDEYAVQPDHHVIAAALASRQNSPEAEFVRALDKALGCRLKLSAASVHTIAACALNLAIEPNTIKAIRRRTQ